MKELLEKLEQIISQAFDLYFDGKVGYSFVELRKAMEMLVIHIANEKKISLINEHGGPRSIVNLFNDPGLELSVKIKKSLHKINNEAKPHAHYNQLLHNLDVEFEDWKKTPEHFSSIVRELYGAELDLRSIEMNELEQKFSKRSKKLRLDLIKKLHLTHDSSFETHANTIKQFSADMSKHWPKGSPKKLEQKEVMKLEKLLHEFPQNLNYGQHIEELIQTNDEESIILGGKIARKFDDKMWLGRCFYAYGLFLFEKENMFDARNNFRKSISCCEELGDLTGKIMSHLWIGRTFDRKQKHLARKEIETSLTISQEINVREMELEALGDLGLVELSLNLKNKSEQTARKAHQLSIEIGDRYQEAYALLLLARLTIEKDKEIAKEFCEDAGQIGREIDDVFVLANYNQMKELLFN
tara:strand:- start:213 stop:1448 length:1236 start_codon:yes stop_codon:yes gene_type:complete